jgi:hypothetical protein
VGRIDAEVATLAGEVREVLADAARVVAVERYYARRRANENDETKEVQEWTNLLDCWSDLC